MTHEMARARRTHSSLGVIMLDMDRFKDLNDTYGHEAGDSLLRAIAEVLTTNIRASDVACRFGGDEFIVLMPGASLDGVTLRGRHLCGLLGDLTLDFHSMKLSGTHCSMGVSMYPGDGASSADLIRAADAALYRDKACHH